MNLILRKERKMFREPKGALELVDEESHAHS